MSKYIIELDDRIKLVTSVGVTENGVVYTTSDYVHNLEELNSDYINEHFGDLQDTAYKKGLHDGESKCRYCNEYQRGFEDGKAVHEKGCEGCEYEGRELDKLPCMVCSNSRKNCFTAKDDKIGVGDEVTNKSDSVVWTAVCIQIDDDGRHMHLMGHTGAVAYYSVENFKKTGRHFDIAKILEDMRK